MDKFIHIRTSKFPVLPGEAAELVNPGTYGKALAKYLQEELKTRGYDAPFYCAEDWGWWVELKNAPFTFGVCVYALSEAGPIMEYACTDGAAAEKKWSWKQFRFIQTGPYVEKLLDDLKGIFDEDDAVEVLGIVEDLPL